jgi:hypothetical protein
MFVPDVSAVFWDIGIWLFSEHFRCLFSSFFFRTNVTNERRDFQIVDSIAYFFQIFEPVLSFLVILPYLRDHSCFLIFLSRNRREISTPLFSEPGVRQKESVMMFILSFLGHFLTLDNIHLCIFEGMSR